MKNYFEIFEISIKFDIDLNELEEKYFAFQNTFHPDKSSIAEKKQFATVYAEIDKSILTNEAYHILKNPLLRAIHLMQLKSFDINIAKPSISTLEEVLEFREKIAEFSLEEILAAKKEIKEKIKKFLTEFSELYHKALFDKALQVLIKAHYYQKIFDDLKKD